MGRLVCPFLLVIVILFVLYVALAFGSALTLQPISKGQRHLPIPWPSNATWLRVHRKNRK